MRPIHDRMPVILSPADYDTWLDPSSKPAQLTAMLVPYAGNELQAFPVSTHVNRPANDDPACVEPSK